MKNNVISFMAYMAILINPLLISSCSDSDDNEGGVIVQPAEVPVCFIVKDSKSNNLLDPEFEGNILDHNIEVTYEGAQYALQLSEYPIDRMFGLYTGEIEVGMDKIPGIMFWYFHVNPDRGNHHFSINWGDGVTDEIKIDYYYTVANGKPVYHRITYLNGKLHSDNSFIINIIK